MKQKYQLETITPVHIGSGETLNHIDGYYTDGRWYHIDLDKVLVHPNVDINALTSEMARRDFRWERHLQQRGMNPAELSTYSVPCQRNPETTDIREAIKSIGNRPYIPGSTLKGALRTALLSHLIDVDDTLFDDKLEYLINLTKQQARGNPRRETPGKNIEEDAFGKDSNHDLLRALQVSDTEPLESDSLGIGLAWTVTLNNNNQLVQKIDNGTEYKNFVEQIQAGQRLTFTLKIDELLFREREKNRLRFGDLQENTLRDFADVCHSETQAFMQDEQNFFDDYNFTEIVDLYDRLIRLNESLLEGTFLLQIGWGTGYHTHTVTSSFTNAAEAPENIMFDLRERFRLGESHSQREHYDEREFPKTRHILYRGQNPVAPLGWVKISPLEDS